MSGDWEAAGTRRRRHPLPALLAGVALLGTAVAGLALWPDPEASERPGDGIAAPEDLTIEPDSPVEAGTPAPRFPDEPGRGTLTATAQAAGAWRSLPAETTVAGRSDPVLTWTGREVLVWGGRDEAGWQADGARYDPWTERWEPIDPAPVRARPTSSGTWVGGRLVVLGGAAGDGSAHAVLDGDGSWRSATAPPEGPWDWSATATLDGSIVVAGTDGQPRFAAYDPAVDAWQGLPGAPLADVRTFEAVSGALVAIGRADEDDVRLSATALDPVAGSWQRPDPAPVPGNWTPRASADPRGGRVLVIGAAQDRRLTHVAAAWSPVDGWQRLPSPPAALSRAAPEAYPTVAGVVVWTPDDPRAAHLLETSGSASEQAPPGRWRPLASPPETVVQGSPAVWTGRELVVWSAAQAAAWSRTPVSATALPPASTPRVEGSWTHVEAGNAGIRRDPQLSSLGDRVVVWGGVGPDGQRADALLIDPGSRRVEGLPAAPDALSGGAAAVAGTERWLLVWAGGAGERGQAGGAVLDVAAGGWRTLEDAPLPPSADASAAPDGESIVVVAGDAAARYHPAEHRWERLAPPPVSPPRGLVPSDGGLLLVAGDGEAARLSDRGWRRVAGHGLDGALGTVGLPTGALAWDGSRGAQFDAASERWHPVSPPWETGTSTALALLDGDVVVWGGALVGDVQAGRFGAALLDPASGRWSVLPDPPGGVSVEGLAAAGGRLLGWSYDGTFVVFEPGSPAGHP